MKKIIYVYLLAIMLLCSMNISAQEIATVYINGNELESDTPAVVINGSTMLPFRAIFNALGILDDQIVWDEVSTSIEVKLADRYIFLAVGSPGAIVNDSMIMLTTIPYIEEGRTMVPLRFVSESLGASVEWDENTQSVYITK